MAPGHLVHRAAQKAPFIKPSTLWTILVCSRSYPHPLTLDLVDDRSFARVWSHAGFGRRWHLGLSPRLTLAAPRRPAAASHRHRRCSRAVLVPTDRRKRTLRENVPKRSCQTMIGILPAPTMPR